MKQFGRIITLATELGVTMGLTAAGLVILGLLLGRWLDARLGTTPFATIVLLIAGGVAGQVAIYRLATNSARRLSVQPPSAETKGLWHAQDATSAAGLALKILAFMAAPAILGLVLGRWVDGMLGTQAIATLVLVLGGLIVGLLGSLRLAQAARRAPGEKDDDV